MHRTSQCPPIEEDARVLGQKSKIASETKQPPDHRVTLRSPWQCFAICGDCRARPRRLALARNLLNWWPLYVHSMSKKCRHTVLEYAIRAPKEGSSSSVELQGKMIEELKARVAGEEFDYRILIDALREYERPRDKITALLRQGTIIRVKKGI